MLCLSVCVQVRLLEIVSGMTIVMWLEQTGVVWSGMAVLIV